MMQKERPRDGRVSTSRCRAALLDLADGLLHMGFKAEFKNSKNGVPNREEQVGRLVLRFLFLIQQHAILSW